MLSPFDNKNKFSDPCKSAFSFQKVSLRGNIFLQKILYLSIEKTQKRLNYASSCFSQIDFRLEKQSLSISVIEEPARLRGKRKQD